MRDGASGTTSTRPATSAHISPVRRRLRRVKQRVTGPHIFDSQVRVLEQVRGLRVDLERILLIQQVRVEPVVGHHLSGLQPNTRVERRMVDPVHEVRRCVSRVTRFEP